MTILFVDFTTWEEHTETDRKGCRNDTERNLWDMHIQIPSDTWKLGKTLAEKITD